MDASSALRYLGLPFYLDEEIDAFEPDVIHSHHPFMMGDAAFRTARRKRLPLVFTHHTRYEEYVHHVAFDSDGFAKAQVTKAVADQGKTR